MIFLLFIVVPIIEISIFITVGSNIGILNTIAIILTTAIVGIFLVRRQGIKLLFDAQKNLSQGGGFLVPCSDTMHLTEDALSNLQC